MKKRNKWSRTGTERGGMDALIEKMGGGSGGSKMSRSSKPTKIKEEPKKSRRGKFGVNKMTKEESKQRAKETKQARIQRQEEKQRDSQKDSRQKEIDRLYGDWSPHTNQPNVSANTIKKASKDYY
tara:strand:+ start:160 stop:534 length:375 start_codon:yes stop_codon:yes gene_type:complete